ncbi:unnamed protein product [Hyaloperonospora brassicae]|uniref:DNA replication checkpoint mediator MRC1 domain-containing protein n=1 Tax=Hyaloperonospora brassicae TaxID=162125 RepID=A0AAV0TIC6_HYABA|nr:unnamed protein product [Hyaloperonospora brassicae]
MSGDDLALETQLLLQGVTTQLTHVAPVEREALESEKPLVSEYEEATHALLAKLRRKKAANRLQQQQLHTRRFGLSAAPSTGEPLVSESAREPTTSKLPLFLKLPVAVSATVASRKKQQMVRQLKTQALQQGALHMAKVFGYTSHEEHVKHLNMLDEKKIRQDAVEERREEEEEKIESAGTVADTVDNGEDTQMLEGGKKKRSSGRADVDESASETELSLATRTTESGAKESDEEKEEEEGAGENVLRRRNRVLSLENSGEEDGNEADSEWDDQKDDACDDIEDTVSTSKSTSDALDVEKATAKHGSENMVTAKATTPADKAAGYRSLLRAEALQNRKRKRLVSSRGNTFVESEAEEDDEEDVLRIGGLGDFGFGVPQSKTQESKEAEEERHALVLREDDLDHIVDNLSDDEKAQEQDLEEMFRREREELDRQQVKEVMRNVKEGFGRNRRAFSGLPSGSGARGRFNLDELVAADGSRFEAARLGLLGSDEELSEDEDDKTKKKTQAHGSGEEEEEEIDEEADMERMLRERFLNQPKIYVTSSESGSDEEEEDAKKESASDGDGIESDEERERQQMKLFSERARINRRMQRMKDMQRQLALQNNGVDPTATSNTAMPNLLLEEDEDSQELMDLLNRTNVTSRHGSQKAVSGSNQNEFRPHASDRKLDRGTSYGGITSASRPSSSFSRVIDQCKIFSANSGNGATPSKSFIFTSFSSGKKADDVGEGPDHGETKVTERLETSDSKGRSSATTMSKRRRALDSNNSAVREKKRKSGGLFSVLSSYQCVSSTKPT